MKKIELKDEIDIGKTIEAIANHKMRYASVNLQKLREKAIENPLLLIDFAKELRVEVVYKK